MNRNIQKGFTLIELLVVISIISLLSSIVMASLSQARAKARDTKVIGDFRQIQTALSLYYDKYKKYPNETEYFSNDHVMSFNSMAGQLVTEKFLTAVPVPPQNHTYQYYNYYTSPGIGGILVTSLETLAPTNVAPLGSCRPFYDNWCSYWSERASNQYCVCNPY